MKKTGKSSCSTFSTQSFSGSIWAFSIFIQLFPISATIFVFISSFGCLFIYSIFLKKSTSSCFFVQNGSRSLNRCSANLSSLLKKFDGKLDHSTKIFFSLQSTFSKLSLHRNLMIVNWIDYAVHQNIHFVFFQIKLFFVVYEKSKFFRYKKMNRLTRLGKFLDFLTGRN